MGDLRVLETDRDLVKRSVIETLEITLEQARAGEVVAVGIAVLRPSGAGNCSFSDSDNCIGLLGAVEILRHRLLNSIEE